MRMMLRQLLAGLRLVLIMTVLLGVGYPLAVWSVSRLPGLHDKAEGSIVKVDGQPVGSALIGIDPIAADPAHDPWFHTRPSASSQGLLGPGDPSTSGGTNLAATNPKQTSAVEQRIAAIAARENIDPHQIPADAVTASGSGLDPDISPTYAQLQIPRVAHENALPEQQVRQLVDDHTENRGWGFLGERHVNVLQLNLAVRNAITHGAPPSR